MNWVGGGIVLVCLGSAINGYRRGLVRTVLAMISFVVIVAVAMVINPLIGDVIVKVTNLDQTAKEYVDGMLTDFMDNYQNQYQKDFETETQADFIANLPLPESVQEGLLENNNQQRYEELGVTSFKEYIAVYLGDALVSGVILIVSLIIAFIGVRLMAGILDEVAEMPVLNTFNRVGGLAFGLFKGMVYIWIFFLVVTIMMGTQWGEALMRMIYRDFVARFLYEHNPVMSVLSRLWM